MATTEPFDLLYAMTLPPEAAVDYFRQKGMRVTGDWHEMLGEIHNQVFTVANCAKLDVLQDIRAALQKAIDGNVSFAEFQKRLKPILQAKGWWGLSPDKFYPGSDRPVQLGSPRRLKLIYDQNLQVAFSAGRRQRQQENVVNRPYWQRLEVMDARTRPSHQALHGMTFPADDPVWNYFYPPDAYRCRGRVTTLSESQVAAQGIRVSNSAGKLDFVEVAISPTNPDLGTTKVARYAISPGKHVKTDPGWSHAPGAGWEPNLTRYDADLVEQYRKSKK